MTLGQVSTAEIQSEVRRRQNEGQKLLRKRGRLVEQVTKIDDDLKALGVPANTSGNLSSFTAPRAKNELSLDAALQKLLKGKEMGIPDIVPALPSVGYVSHSPNLRTMVNASLLKRSLFKRVGRGVYTAK